MNKKTLGIVVVVLLVIVFIVLSNRSKSESANLKIAVSAALTGPAAYIGESYVSGLKAAQTEINSNGGIAGKLVDLYIEDNKNNAKEGITAFRALEIKKPDLFISTMSTPSVPVSPLVKESGIPLLVSIVFADVTSKNENAVSFFPTADNDARATIQDMILNKVNNVGVLYLNSEYGQANLASFIKEAGQNKINVTDQESFLDTTTDFVTIVTKILAKKPQAVYVIAINSTPIIKQLKAHKSKSVIYANLPPVFGNLVYKDKETFEGVHLTASRASIPGTDEYTMTRTKLNDLNATSTLGYSAVGYDSLMTIKAVLTKNPDVKMFVKTFSEYGTLQGINGPSDLTSRNVGITLYPVVLENGEIKEIK